MQRLSTMLGALALAATAAVPAAHAQRVTKAPPAADPSDGQACRWQARQAPSAPQAAAEAPVALKDAFRDAFLVGAAVNADVIFERDAGAVALLKRQFNSISPEDVLKWECVHPRPGVYDFAAPDRYVELGTRNGMAVIGHTLVWHSQVPRWVFQDAAGQPVGRDTALARMREHIRTVVGRYKGRIKGWDVVNEALNEDGTLRDSPWRRAIGDDYIVKAFEYAHEADPGAELYYNDYNLATPAKRDGAVRLVKQVIAAGVPVRAIGSQDHHKLDWPSPALVDSMLAAFAAAGVHASITELDVDVLPRVTRSTGADVSTRGTAGAGSNPYVAGLPDSVEQALARRYGELFAVYLKHKDVVDRVTLWGVRDGDSWLNDWPARGRTSYPLLFDRQGRPKPAFDAVVRQARRTSAAR
jgi:endo-1,4-beta-xylanase